MDRRRVLRRLHVTRFGPAGADVGMDAECGSSCQGGIAQGEGKEGYRASHPDPGPDGRNRMAPSSSGIVGTAQQRTMELASSPQRRGWISLVKLSYLALAGTGRLRNAVRAMAAGK